MVHRTRKHHKRQRGGRSENGEPDVVPDAGSVSETEPELESGNVQDVLSGGGKRRGRGGRGRSGRGGRRSSRSSHAGSRKGGRRKGGRRSHKGGFLAGLGAMLHESLVPVGLSLYTIKKSKRSRVSRGGRDDIA